MAVIGLSAIIIGTFWKQKDGSVVVEPLSQPTHAPGEILASAVISNALWEVTGAKDRLFWRTLVNINGQLVSTNFHTNNSVRQWEFLDASVQGASISPDGEYLLVYYRKQETPFTCLVKRSDGSMIRRPIAQSIYHHFWTDDSRKILEVTVSSETVTVSVQKLGDGSWSIAYPLTGGDLIPLGLNAEGEIVLLRAGNKENQFLECLTLRQDPDTVVRTNRIVTAKNYILSARAGCLGGRFVLRLVEAPKVLAKVLWKIGLPERVSVDYVKLDIQSQVSESFLPLHLEVPIKGTDRLTFNGSESNFWLRAEDLVLNAHLSKRAK